MQCECCPQSLLSERFPGRSTTAPCRSQCTAVGRRRRPRSRSSPDCYEVIPSTCLVIQTLRGANAIKLCEQSCRAVMQQLVMFLPKPMIMCEIKLVCHLRNCLCLFSCTPVQWHKLDGKLSDLSHQFKCTISSTRHCII